MKLNSRCPIVSTQCCIIHYVSHDLIQIVLKFSNRLLLLVHSNLELNYETLTPPRTRGSFPIVIFKYFLFKFLCFLLFNYLVVLKSILLSLWEDTLPLSPIINFSNLGLTIITKQDSTS